MQRYSDPYLAGVALGLVLLAAFAFAGRGLGASGAFTTAAAELTNADSALFARYRDGDYWLVVEIVGVIIGGFLSALLARRFAFKLERGRLGYAFAGGSLMGLGAVLARGCTSGLGLTGGALLSVGSWLFIVAAFAAAYAVSPFVRKAWQ